MYFFAVRKGGRVLCYFCSSKLRRSRGLFRRPRAVAFELREFSEETQRTAPWGGGGVLSPVPPAPPGGPVSLDLPCGVVRSPQKNRHTNGLGGCQTPPLAKIIRRVGWGRSPLPTNEQILLGADRRSAPLEIVFGSPARAGLQVSEFSPPNKGGLVENGTRGGGAGLKSPTPNCIIGSLTSTNLTLTPVTHQRLPLTVLRCTLSCPLACFLTV